MPNPVESDDDTPTSMDVEKSESTVDVNGADESKKAAKSLPPKPLPVPFFVMNSDGVSMTTYLYDKNSLKSAAQLTLEEMDASSTFYQEDPVHKEDKEDKYMDVATMYLNGTSQEAIDQFVAEKSLDVKGVKFYKPKIPIDPTVDEGALLKIAKGEFKTHESLQTAIDNSKGINMDEAPYCCNLIHEIGAKKTAQKTYEPVVCLSYGTSNKVSTNNIDSVFNIERPKADKADKVDKVDKADKVDNADNADKKKSKTTVDDVIAELEKNRTQSGYTVKVALYKEAMQMSMDGPPDGMELEEMISEAWCQDHDRDAETRRDFIRDKESASNDSKLAEKIKKLKEKDEMKKSKLAEYVKTEAQKVREDVVQKHCEIKESNIKKAAGLKLARNTEFKKGDDKYNVELNKLMDQQRKDMKEKLIPKSDKKKLEGISKKQFYMNLRRKRLKKSQIVCPVTLTSYTPLTNKCPVGDTENVTEPQKKLLDKSKKIVVTKYAVHAARVKKKGFAVKLFI